jgi:cyclophilin family peptidyl-prolyl cis-trans isomerase
VLAQLQQQHPAEVRIVFRQFPLVSIHDKAALAAQAAEAAGLQGKFWELHDLLFDKQDQWSQLSTQDFEQWIQSQAVSLGLDTSKFKADLKCDDVATKVQAAWEDGQKIGLPGTPFVLINGQIYSGPRDFDSLDQIVQLITLGKRQFSQCPPMSIDPTKQYLATLETEKGQIILQLYPDKAPLAVNNFVYLANQGWFNDITFHRVIPGFVAQTGDPSGTGQGNPGYVFKNEIDSTLKFDKPGVVGMANSGPDTNGSQFFITYAAASHLDGSYTIFGQVISGMDVLEKLTPRDPQPGGTPLPPGDKLLGVTIQEK